MYKEEFFNLILSKIDNFKELKNDLVIEDEENNLFFIFNSDIDYQDGSVSYGDITFYYDKNILEINVWSNGSKFLYNLTYNNFDKPDYLDIYLKDLDEARKRFLSLYSKKYDFLSVKRKV